MYSKKKKKLMNLSHSLRIPIFPSSSFFKDQKPTFMKENKVQKQRIQNKK